MKAMTNRTNIINANSLHTVESLRRWASCCFSQPFSRMLVTVLEWLTDFLTGAIIESRKAARSKAVASTSSSNDFNKSPPFQKSAIKLCITHYFTSNGMIVCWNTDFYLSHVILLNETISNHFVNWLLPSLFANAKVASLSFIFT